MNLIGSQTKLIGLLGKPVSHSLSPVMQNAALAELRVDLCYLAFPCNTEDLTEILKGLRAIDCRGLNVTIPHKQTVLQNCTELSELAKKVSAVNTLVPDQQNGWKGLNTDVEGFLAPLFLRKTDWEGLNAVVLGSGGSARAITTGLKELKLKKISIIGRNSESLNRFTEDMGSNWQQLNASFLKGYMQEDKEIIKEIGEADLIVNTTPIGMNVESKYNSNKSQIPLGQKIWGNLNKNAILYDLIYTPRPTPWLQWGLQEGLECIDGLDMLVEQGAASLRLWTGIDEIPVNLMKEAALSSLNA